MAHTLGHALGRALLYTRYVAHTQGRALGRAFPYTQGKKRVYFSPNQTHTSISCSYPLGNRHSPHPQLWLWFWSI